MFTLLIADDEPTIRRGLSKMIPWSTMDVKLIGEAEDGAKALALMRENQPDILITDIRMPNMDGLALAQTVSEEFPEISVIILTGYADFSYAQTAIRYGAVDFVLKPTSKEKISAAVKRAQERLLAEHRLAVGDDLNILREQFLEQLTRGLTDKQEMDHRMHTYELHLDSYRMAAFQFVEYSTEHKQRNLTALKNLVASLNPIGYTYFFDDYMVLSLFPAQRNPASLEPILKACLEVCGIVNRFSDTCICAGISLCHEGAASLSLAGDEAVRALSRHFFSEETVSVYQLIPEEPSPKDMAEESFLCGLETLLNSYDFEPLWPKLQAYFSRQRSGIANADEVIDTCRQIYYICVRVLARNERESLSTELLTAISQSTNLTSLEKAVARILENTQEILRHPSAQASPAVASAVEYIYAHYADSLYLNDIAEYVHLNPHHLCRIFKKERGETINEYITHVRIEKAKRLLREGNLAYESRNR